MGNVAKINALSGSTNGRPILVDQTSIGTGTVLHTCGALTADGEGDKIELWAFNADTVTRVLKLGLGGVSDPGDVITISMPAGSWEHVLPCWFGNNSLVVRGSCDVANKVSIVGYRLRVS